MVLDVADAAFDLSLGPGTTRTTRPGGQSAIAAKASKPGFQTTSPVWGSWEVTRGEALSQRTCSVRPPKWPEGPIQALEPVVLPLGEEGPAGEPA